MNNNFLVLLKNRLRKEYYFLKRKYQKRLTINESINKYYIRKFLPSKPIIIDAGAHIGDDSVEMARLYPKSKIYAFEPVPGIYKRLLENTSKYKRITCYPLALSNNTGEQVMYVSSGGSDGSSSLMQPKDHLKDHPDVYFEEEIKVKTLTLDDWASQQQVEQVDFLWLDMQGYELEVLKASSVIFPKVKVVHMEVSTRSTYEGVPLYGEVKEWMLSKGFKIEVEAIPAGWDMGNVLFVRNLSAY